MPLTTPEQTEFEWPPEVLDRIAAVVSDRVNNPEMKPCKVVQLKGIFIHNNEMHMQVQPSKFLVNSSIIYEVVMRGDVFAVNLHTNRIVVLPHSTPVVHVNVPAISTMAVKK